MAGNGIAMTEQDVTDGIGLLMEQISSLTDSSMAGELASGGPRLKVQVSSFRNAVREVFGADSHEFSEFGTLEMFGGPLRVGMSSTELHAARVKGRDHMVEVARELIQRLQRRLRSISGRRIQDSPPATPERNSGEFKFVAHFKKSSTLTTDVGNFTFEGLLGQGGNAHVLKFTKGSTSFAVKFLEHLDHMKLARLKDEFFSAAQLTTHPNVARNYHFDQVTLDDRSFSLIIMRLYGTSLKKRGPLDGNLEEEARAESATKLFNDLLDGLEHLHAGKVVHRDLKPENVFVDERSNSYVIGDLGIAHFSEEFPREAETRHGERLGNYMFSPREQAVPGNVPVPANDLFALGQVVQWFVTGSTHRGVGRMRLADPESSTGMRVLDLVVDACLRDDVLARPQSVEEVRKMIAAAKSPSRDITLRGDDLDRAICMSYDQIDKVWFSTRLEDITEFIENFSKECRSEEMCTVYMDGGDVTGARFESLGGRRWLLNGVDELLIENIIAYRDPSRTYKSFFIVLASPDEAFQWTDENGVPVNRPTRNSEFPDAATLFDGRYLDAAIAERSYFKVGGKPIEVTRERFSRRQRHLRWSAYLIVPDRSAASCMTDRSPMEDLLESVTASRRLDDDPLNQYLQATRSEHSRELTKWD
ncbi:protein kinase [Mitsuaria sp. TWR114]|uniref:protein kinase domain-containing protein n=1 Tax=Mitsuaria sp. TWR114 TaxID=2601731 RepID=UPI0011BEECF4|nr:protein kinase [Mitsuaria sp. TWR114]TXD99045.1 protein kinase [Mitsuaria sp. TWR114]